MKLEKALKSKALYYVALVLMVVNVLGYVSVGSVECVIVFAVTYYLSNSYTKNQSLDILIGLFVANVVFGCGRVREGFEDDSAGALKKVAAQEHLHARKNAVDAHKCPAGKEFDTTKKKCAKKAAAHLAVGNAAMKAAVLAEAAKKK